MLPTILPRLALLAAATLSAQQPAPTTETENAVWSAEEANQLFYLRANFDTLRDTAQPVQFGGRVVKSAHYGLAFFIQDEAGEPVLAQSVAKKQAAFAIAWPRTVGGESQRGILMHSDGTTLFCEPAADDAAELTADLALAKGGTGKFGDALRQPGTGSKGHLWLWLSQTGFQAKVQVLDERGKPRPDITVDVCGEGPGPRSGPAAVHLPQPLPLAQGKTNASGVAVLQGPRCAATVALLRTPAFTILGNRVTVEEGKGGVRFVVPDAALVDAALAANESMAIGRLKNIASAQAQCQASAAIDVNKNGAGEYGFFGELSGAIAVRSDDKGGVGQQTIAPPVLSHSFIKVVGSRVACSGYLFQMFLPDSKCQPTAEAATGGGAGVAIDGKKAEVMWCGYAWPASPTSGRRAFFINQGGDILACDNTAGYCGVDKPPSPDAAFAAGTTGAMDCGIAANTKGRDGQTWTVVN
jgi:hypothetical protein